MHKTTLTDQHRARGAKMTDFHGWEMPMYFSSTIEEHTAVRQTFGMFDISHMGQVLVHGSGAIQMLNHLFVSDLEQVAEGRACYTLMLNEAGGILDDLIVYRIGTDSFLIIVNCGTHASDVAWLTSHAGEGTRVSDISDGRSILAIQGPRACRVLEQLLDARVTSLGRFGIAPIRTMGPNACIARTGYTGSDGFELFVPDRHARALWEALLRAGAAVDGLPVGLGARDTLRIEAGLRLYGADIDETTTPYEAGLGWTVAINKSDFIGKAALVRQQETGVKRCFVGVEFAEGPVPRAGTELFDSDQRVGRMTSGTFSPTLNRPVGMGYVEESVSAPGMTLSVTVRNRTYHGTIVKLPFWKPAPAMQEIR